MSHADHKTNGYRPGLDGVTAAETQLSHIDGLQGKLIVAGFPIEELASHANFEEVVLLLWDGALPTHEQLHHFRQRLVALRPLPTATLDLLEAVAKEKMPVMDALRIGAGTLDLESDGSGDSRVQAELLLARIPTTIAAYWRLRKNQRPISPDPKLDHAANYLYMLTGERPSEARTRGLETYLNTVIEHGLNASTFAARVIIATQSDIVSAIVGAIGALKGPRHGGAPGPALDMVFDIGEASRAEPYLRAKLDRRELLMGFGHRVYKVRDPRADVLAASAEIMYRADGNMALYRLAKHVEETAVRLLAEYKPEHNFQTNVEFYTALLLHGLGLDTELFTPTFAMARVAGWIAHCFEHQKEGRIIRPLSKYIGEEDRTWIPLAER